MLPVVSVVIPTRNRRARLSRTLRSVLAQAGAEVEVIVVDDASEDDTRDWLDGTDESRLVVVRHPQRQGVAQARNSGIERATSPWIAFVDDDDLWAPAKLAAQLEAAARDRTAEWVLAGAVVLDRELRIRAAQRVVSRDRFLSLLLGHNVVPGGASGVLAKTEAVQRVGGFDPQLEIMADWDLWIRLALESLPAAVDRPLVGYVLHGANMTSRPVSFRRELEYINAKHSATQAKLGVTPNDRGWSEWLSEVQRRSGLRVAPALVQARLAVTHRHPRAVARALAIALWPGWTERRDRWRIERISSSWLDEAEAWLEPIRGEADALPVPA